MMVNGDGGGITGGGSTKKVLKKAKTVDVSEFKKTLNRRRSFIH